MEHITDDEDTCPCLPDIRIVEGGIIYLHKNKED